MRLIKAIYKIFEKRALGMQDPLHQQLKQTACRRIYLPSPACRVARSAIVVQFTINGYGSNGRMSVIIHHHALSILQKCHYGHAHLLFTQL